MNKENYVTKKFVLASEVKKNVRKICFAQKNGCDKCPLADHVHHYCTGEALIQEKNLEYQRMEGNMYIVIRPVVYQPGVYSYCYKVSKRFHSNTKKLIDTKHFLETLCEVIILSRPEAYPEYGPYKRAYTLHTLINKAIKMVPHPATAPCEYLKKCLDTIYKDEQAIAKKQGKELTRDQFNKQYADMMALTKSEFRHLMNNELHIDLLVAEGISTALGTSRNLWINLQKAYDQTHRGHKYKYGA